MGIDFLRLIFICYFCCELEIVIEEWNTMSIYRELSRVFSPTFLIKMTKGQCNTELKFLANHFDELSNYIGTLDFKLFFDRAYKILLKNYRFEYVYKNEIYKYLFEIYGIVEEDGILTEVRSGNNIADLVYFNGTSKVYEIKSEIDSNDRLFEQVQSYSQLFKEINVVTYEKNGHKILDLLPEHVGIIIFDYKKGFQTVRKSLEFTNNLNTVEMFKTLRRKEYENIIVKKFNRLPDVSDARIFSECMGLFVKIQPVEAHDLMIEELKKRSPKEILIPNNKWPDSISFLVENSKLKIKEKNKLAKLIS